MFFLLCAVTLADITQHLLKRRDAPSKDCRPPKIYRYTGNEDEGSVRLTGYHHPAKSRLYYGQPGTAGFTNTLWGVFISPLFLFIANKIKVYFSSYLKNNKSMKNIRLYFYGLIIGLVNALFGAGGGIIAVNLIKNLGADQKEASATTLAIMLPLSVVTAIIYLSKGFMTFKDPLPFILPGFIGALIGSMIFKKCNNKFLRKAFALFMLWAGMRFLMK